MIKNFNGGIVKKFCNNTEKKWNDSDRFSMFQFEKGRKTVKSFTCIILFRLQKFCETVHKQNGLYLR